MMVADLFVGAVSVAIGTAAMLAAIGNGDFFYQFAKIRWIERKGGRTAARLFYALLGMSLLILGAAIAAGFGPNKTPRPERTRSEMAPKTIDANEPSIDRVTPRPA